MLKEIEMQVTQEVQDRHLAVTEQLIPQTLLSQLLPNLLPLVAILAGIEAHLTFLKVSLEV